MPLLSGKKMFKFSPHATPWKNLISVVSLFLLHSKLCHTKPTLCFIFMSSPAGRLVSLRTPIRITQSLPMVHFGEYLFGWS